MHTTEPRYKTMTKQKSTKTPTPKDVAGQLEQAFLAGLGALAKSQEAGEEAFKNLIKQGQSFRQEATAKTESLIGDVQDAIRSMGSDAQSRATGLLEQMRETPQMEKIQDVFDARVAEALGRIGVASKQSIDDLNDKLDRVLATMEKEKAAQKKVAKKKVAKKKVARKKAAKKATRKATRKSPAKKKPAKRAAKKVSKKKSS